MSPSKKKSASYVLTGRSATLTLGLPDSDETLTLERGVPTEVDNPDFAEQIDQHENTRDLAIYPEGEVPEDAILGPPVPEPAAAVAAPAPPAEAPATPDVSDAQPQAQPEGAQSGESGDGETTDESATA